MDAGPGTDLGTLGFFLTAWVVMMAAMMFPSIWPMVVIYARVQHGKRERGQEAAGRATPLFVCGYLVTWAAAGLVGFAIFEAARSLSIDLFSWDRGGPYLAGGVIIAAALYQLTPLKDVCLRKCRSPLAFVLHSWHPGRSGALRMGIEHGAWCVGLLLGADGSPVRARSDERRLDGADRRPDSAREAAAVARSSQTAASRSCWSCSGSRSRSRPRTFPASPSPIHPRPRERCRKCRWKERAAPVPGETMDQGGGGSMQGDGKHLRTDPRSTTRTGCACSTGPSAPSSSRIRQPCRSRRCRMSPLPVPAPPRCPVG